MTEEAIQSISRRTSALIIELYALRFVSAQSHFKAYRE